MNPVSKLVLASLPVLGLAACGGGSDVGQAIGTSAPQVRLANVSPAAPSLTLERNNGARSEATNVGYPTITNYFDVDTGDATWSVRMTGNGNVVGTQNFDSQRGHRYTILAVADSATSTSLAQINDPTNFNLVSDDSRLRVFNASYNAQNIDVYLIGQTQNIASLNPDLSSIGFKQTGPGNGTDSLRRRGSSSSDPYRIVVTTAGTKNILFQGNYVVRDRQDVLFVTVPNSAQNPTGINVIVKQNDDTTVTIPRL